MEGNGPGNLEITTAEIIAPWPSAALLRLRGRGRPPREVTLHYVTSDGSRGTGWRLPGGADRGGDGWTVAFGLPHSAVRTRSCTLALGGGGEATTIPWSPPDPLVSGSRRPWPAGEVRTGADAEKKRRGTAAVHRLVALAGWVLYSAEMTLQTTAHLPAGWGDLLMAVAVATVVIALLTVGWVGWNVWLHRRHGERRGRAPTLTPELRRDRLGRPILSSVASPADARRVLVTVSAADAKLFLEEPLPGA